VKIEAAFPFVEELRISSAWSRSPLRSWRWREIPLSLRRGTVTGVDERVRGLVRCRVDGEPCVAYPQVTGPVALGDEVVVNEQARALGLGSGGFAPLQFATRHVEEDAALPETLAGTPVVCCSLHSQVAPAAAALRGVRVAYVQLPGGALPLALSDTIRALREHGLVATTASVGPCFGGDVECVTTASALAWAASEHEVVLCAIGPGIVGTASRLGHGGVAAAEAANAATALGGSPVLAVRVSGGDERARHRGVSHHTRAVVELCAGEVAIAWPSGLEAPDWLPRRDEVDVGEWRESCEGLPLEHMGRGPDDDPWFFASAFAAGKLARERAAA
jgi:hypothetical protein